VTPLEIHRVRSLSASRTWTAPDYGASINADLNAVPLKNAGCTDAAQKGAFAIKAMLNGAGLFTRQADFAAGTVVLRSVQPLRMDAANLKNRRDNNKDESSRQTIFHLFCQGTLRIP
jgi:hypothetical protein